MELTARDKVNVVVIGHVDAGKSTTTGHLIFLNGGIDKRTLEKYKQSAIEEGKESFGFAFAMDTLEEERKRGVTINCNIKKFKTEHRDYSIIDAPGHKDFIKNMIKGTQQADAAVLMIDARIGEFEAGVSKDGSTREHVLLAQSMGLKQIIVAINKMDDKIVDYSEERYTEIKDELSIMLKKVGCRPKLMKFIPISGWTGENLNVKAEENMPWYDGPTLIEAIDSLKAPKRPTEQPLRIPVQSVIIKKGIGTIVVGCVESGIVRVGQQVTFAPGGFQSEIKSIEAFHESVDQAVAGDNIGFIVRGGSKKDIKKGYVCGDTDECPPQVVESFEALVQILKVPNSIKVGYSPVLDIHQISCPGNFVEFINKQTATDVEENPTELKSGDRALVKIKPSKAIVAEKFDEFAQLGRFVCRDNNETKCIGVIKKVNYVDESEAKGKAKKGGKKGKKA